MAMRITSSVEGLIINLEQAGGKIRKAMNDEMEFEAGIVAKIARDMVPVDHGDMEKAIKVDHDSSRRSWYIYVDESSGTTPGGRSKALTVGEYAMWLHEDPDHYDLGKNSRDKQATVKYPVGAKFMERALAARVNSGLLNRLAARAKSLGILN